MHHKVHFVKAEGTRLLGGLEAFSPVKILKFGPLRMHFLHPGARFRVFEHNTNIIKFWLLYSERVHE